MRAVSFLSVYAGAADISGLDLADMSAEQLSSLVRKINRRLRKGWKFDRFPEINPVERRLYRPEYNSATAYPAPTTTAPSEVFFTPAGKYYQALRATTGNAPANLVAGVYVVDAAFWAESASGYSGNDWVTLTVYAVGDVVRNPADGNYYACHTAHTAGASFSSADFGLLTPFAPYVSRDQAGETPIGEVLRLYARDPGVYRGTAGVIRHTVQQRGIVPLGCCPMPAVWVQFRLRVPVFTNVEWAAATNYAINDVRYSPAAENCYRALNAIVGNPSNPRPEDDAANWKLIEFPEVLADFTMRAAGSDLLKADGQTEKAAREQAQAYAELDSERDVENEGQGISPDSVQVEGY